MELIAGLGPQFRHDATTECVKQEGGDGVRMNDGNSKMIFTPEVQFKKKKHNSDESNCLTHFRHGINVDNILHIDSTLHSWSLNCFTEVDICYPY